MSNRTRVNQLLSAKYAAPSSVMVDLQTPAVSGIPCTMAEAMAVLDEPLPGAFIWVRLADGSRFMHVCGPGARVILPDNARNGWPPKGAA